MAEDTSLNAVELATELTIAWLGNQNNRVQAEDVPAFLRTMHATLNDLANPGSAGEGATVATEAAAEDAAEQFAPAVSVRKSLGSKDHIISLIDGKPYKTLRRHLAAHGLTPEQYRARYKLKPDYPMVSEAYSESRREMAKRIGLGQQGRAAKAAAAAVPPAPAPAAEAPAKPKRAPRSRAKAG